MAYTYLITGATSDVGAALIRHLLTEAPGEDRTILAQGCGDLARLDALVQHRQAASAFRTAHAK